MILEALHHFLTPAAKEIKTLGFVRESIAIEARYKRCRHAWKGHLDKCQQHILTAASDLKEKATIMIIGSGALHDAPVDELLLLGHRIVLVDIVHLAKIRRKYTQNDQITFLEQDVTGLIKPLFDWQEGARSPMATEVRNKLAKIDLVISLNILSQLPINLIKYAARQNIPLPNDFENILLGNHLDLLHNLAPKHLIISDLERQYWVDGETAKRETALPKNICQRLQKPCDTWDWHIAPKGELDKDISLLHKVACWPHAKQESFSSLA
ncbi:MAG: hypothetical protein L3J58_04365 [Emcibacter sp.]|nr:hypothetical protein [Emcibacter sp.]